MVASGGRYRLAEAKNMAKSERFHLTRAHFEALDVSPEADGARELLMRAYS